MVGSRRCDKHWMLLALLLALPAHAQGRRLEAGIARVDSPLAVLEQVAIELDWPPGAATGELQVRAARLHAPALGYDLRAVGWHCTLERGDAGWGCAGQASARGLGSARLEASQTPDGGALRLRRDAAEFALQLPGDGHATLLRARALPLAWLQPLLASAWPEARFTGGTLRADLRLGSGAGGPLRLDGTLGASALGLDTDDGRIATAGLGLDGRVDLSFGDAATAVELDLAAQGGELLVGPLYAVLPPRGASLGLSAEGSAGRWQVSRLRWTDPGALVLDARLLLDAAGEVPLREVELSFASDDLALAGERYLSGLLGMAGLGGLHLAGGLDGRAAIAGGSLQTVLVTASAVDAEDARGRFAVQGLDGSLGWQRSGPALQGEARWGSARLYTLALGAARLAWESTGGRWSLREPLAMPLHGGTLAFEQLALAAPGEGAGELALSMALSEVELAGLTRALDWPPFAGTLSGRIPAARYEDGVLTLDGGLELQVFDGRVQVGALRMERPFGVAPTLATDLRIERLDLVPLTEAFGFGRISGRLDGRIDGLRLVDWQPVAFDAVLRTSTSAPDRRRISQRAVSDLSSVGGGGAAAGLQARVLKMFETFPYEQIGLACRLENNVCTMGGLGPAGGDGGGYTIVEGSGLPRITVVGHQRRVDWPVLVARLRAATAGQGPVVD